MRPGIHSITLQEQAFLPEPVQAPASAFHRPLKAHDCALTPALTGLGARLPAGWTACGLMGKGRFLHEWAPILEYQCRHNQTYMVTQGRL